MEPIEKSMRELCQELGIEVVSRDEYPTFFEEEEKCDIAQLFKEPIKVNLEYTTAGFSQTSCFNDSKYVEILENSSSSDVYYSVNGKDERLLHNKLKVCRSDNFNFLEKATYTYNSRAIA